MRGVILFQANQPSENLEKIHHDTLPIARTMSPCKKESNGFKIWYRWRLLRYFLLISGISIHSGYFVESKVETIAHAAVLTAATKRHVPSRDRVVRTRQERGTHNRFRDNDKPIEGPNYLRMNTFGNIPRQEKIMISNITPEIDSRRPSRTLSQNITSTHRRAGQLASCCSTYANLSASDLCSLYSQDCKSGKTKSHDDGDQSCTQQGLSFIGISFSVSSKYGNPYSYQLCDQFPMENLIDRDYKYVMSMDEDGWLVGGGYKQFDYSGKMPYIDSSHTELLRIGSLDVSKGGTSIEQVYKAMSSISFEPFPIYPEYLKGGGGHRHEKEGEKGGSHDREGENKQGENGREGERNGERGEERGEGKDEHRRKVKENEGNGNSGSAPSGDITLIVSVVEVYSDGSAYSTYQSFLNKLFGALEKVNEGSCVDDHDTDPHVSMARGVKFKSSYHMQQYTNLANWEVAVWQAMYPKGVVIGSDSYAVFPFGKRGKKNWVGYGNLYFFFDRANITKAFPPSRSLSKDESYYATLYQTGKVSKFYESVSKSGNYNDEGGDNDSWEYNPYNWKTSMAIHDQTDGWDLPPNCQEEGETFVGIPLSRKSSSNLQTTSTFQQQFNFEYLLDRNFTYILGLGTNHGWLVGGEQTGNGAGSIVDKDTAHIPLFYLGTTNPNMGGMSLSNMIKVLKTVQFGTLYIKPAFVFADSNGHLKLQFEADPYSSMGYLYDNLCQMLGIKWNYISPYNKLGLYTSCSMHAAGDRASYGCGPSSSNSGGFCPQMTLAYAPKFKSQDAAAAYITNANNYVDYWRNLYPHGVAVGTDSFCKSKSWTGYNGGCLGLFLNRMDLYYVLAPDLSGAWVEFNGNAGTPTHSPAPTYAGGCEDPRNLHLDKCFKMKYGAPMSSVRTFWINMNKIGRLSIISLSVMSVVFTVAFMIVRIRRRQRRALRRLLGIKKRTRRGDKRSSSGAARSSRSRSGKSREHSRKSKTGGIDTNGRPIDHVTEAMSYQPPSLETRPNKASDCSPPSHCRSPSHGSASRSNGSTSCSIGSEIILPSEIRSQRSAAIDTVVPSHNRVRSNGLCSIGNGIVHPLEIQNCHSAPMERDTNSSAQQGHRRNESTTGAPSPGRSRTASRSRTRSRATNSEGLSPNGSHSRSSSRRHSRLVNDSTHHLPPQFPSGRPHEPPVSARRSASPPVVGHAKSIKTEEYDPTNHPNFYLT